MMRIIGGLFLAAWLLVPMGAWADGFAELRKDSARIKTLSADFVQKKTMKMLSKPLVSEGRFFFVAPDALRWEYCKPIRSVVISNKGITKRYIASGGKMVEDSTGGAQAMKIVLDEVAGWMSGRFDANPAFRASLQEGNPVVITLWPAEKSMTGFFEKIEIAVSKKDAQIKSVRIVESGSAETRIDFLRVAVNSKIDPSVFQDVQ
jgi:outer membrane lipoprotein-sorting protein